MIDVQKSVKKVWVIDLAVCQVTPFFYFRVL
jgi:hypothetical protein